MIFGDPKRFGVECEITRICKHPDHDGRFALGRLRLWLADRALGSYSEEMLGLRATTGALADPLKLPDPEDSEAQHMPADDVLRTIQEIVYGDRYEPAASERWSRHQWIWGAEGFEAIRSVRIGLRHGHRIIWQHDKDERSHEIKLSREEYEKAVTDFLVWYRSQLGADAHL